MIKILNRNPNITEEYILKYPNENWNIKYLIDNNKITDFNVLSKFKYIDKDIIKKYPNKPWDWKWLIENTNIKLEIFIQLDIIEKYKHKWDYLNLSRNPNITEEYILKYPNENWNIKYLIDNNKITDFNTLSKFKNINKNILNRYSNKPWNWEWLIENTNIKLEIFIQLDIIEKYKHKWNYLNLSRNPNITEEYILKYPNENWNIKYLIDNNKITDFNTLSKFKYIDKDIIKKYPNKPWDWEWLIENTNIKLEIFIQLDIIEKYKHKWDYLNLSRNPNITEEYILKYPNENWNIKYLIDNNKITDFNTLSKFKNINKNILNRYSNKPWDWEWLIENTNIKLEIFIQLDIIEKYKHKWNYLNLSRNPNITEEYILKYYYKNWDIFYLIENDNITDYKKFTILNKVDYVILRKYPDKPWDWEYITYQKKISIDNLLDLKCNYIIKNPFKFDRYKYLEYHYKYIKNIQDFILKHPYNDFDLYELIRNNKITDFKTLSKNINIDYNIINKYPDKPWDWEWLVKRNIHNIELFIPNDILIKYFNKYINNKNIIKNKNINKDFIKKYHYKILF